MESLKDMLRLARENRERRQARQAQSPARQAQSEEAPPRRALPLKEGHAGYSALMRRHDRVHMRHIGGKDGA